MIQYSCISIQKQSWVRLETVYVTNMNHLQNVTGYQGRKNLHCPKHHHYLRQELPGAADFKILSPSSCMNIWGWSSLFKVKHSLQYALELPKKTCLNHHVGCNIFKWRERIHKDQCKTRKRDVRMWYFCIQIYAVFCMMGSKSKYNNPVISKIQKLKFREKTSVNFGRCNSRTGNTSITPTKERDICFTIKGYWQSNRVLGLLALLDGQNLITSIILQHIWIIITPFEYHRSENVAL